MARKPLSPEPQRRLATVVSRMTKREKEIIREAARERQMTVSSFLYQAAMDAIFGDDRCKAKI